MDCSLSPFEPHTLVASPFLNNCYPSTHLDEKSLSSKINDVKNLQEVFDDQNSIAFALFSRAATCESVEKTFQEWKERLEVNTKKTSQIAAELITLRQGIVALSDTTPSLRCLQAAEPLVRLIQQQNALLKSLTSSPELRTALVFCKTTMQRCVEQSTNNPTTETSSRFYTIIQDVTSTITKHKGKQQNPSQSIVSKSIVSKSIVSQINDLYKDALRFLIYSLAPLPETTLLKEKKVQLATLLQSMSPNNNAATTITKSLEELNIEDAVEQDTIGDYINSFSREPLSNPLQTYFKNAPQNNPLMASLELQSRGILLLRNDVLSTIRAICQATIDESSRAHLDKKISFFKKIADHISQNLAQQKNSYETITISKELAELFHCIAGLKCLLSETNNFIQLLTELSNPLLLRTIQPQNSLALLTSVNSVDDNSSVEFALQFYELASSVHSLTRTPQGSSFVDTLTKKTIDTLVAIISKIGQSKLAKSEQDTHIENQYIYHQLDCDTLAPELALKIKLYIIKECTRALLFFDPQKSPSYFFDLALHLLPAGHRHQLHLEPLINRYLEKTSIQKETSALNTAAEIYNCIAIVQKKMNCPPKQPYLTAFYFSKAVALLHHLRDNPSIRIQWFLKDAEQKLQEIHSSLGYPDYCMKTQSNSSNNFSRIYHDTLQGLWPQNRSTSAIPDNPVNAFDMDIDLFSDSIPLRVVTRELALNKLLKNLPLSQNEKNLTEIVLNRYLLHSDNEHIALRELHEEAMMELALYRAKGWMQEPSNNPRQRTWHDLLALFESFISKHSANDISACQTLLQNVETVTQNNRDTYTQCIIDQMKRLINK